jgi:hypothetical protein
MNHSQLRIPAPPEAHEAVLIDGWEQVVACFQQLRSVPDAQQRWRK